MHSMASSKRSITLQHAHLSKADSQRFMRGGGWGRGENMLRNYPSVTLTRISGFRYFRFQNSDFRFRISGFIYFRFQISCFRFQLSDFRFQVSDFRFQVSGFRLQISHVRFQVSDFRCRISDFRSLMLGEPGSWGWGNRWEDTGVTLRSRAQHPPFKKLYKNPREIPKGIPS